jgi:hypothetical protein
MWPFSRMLRLLPGSHVRPSGGNLFSFDTFGRWRHCQVPTTPFVVLAGVLGSFGVVGWSSRSDLPQVIRGIGFVSVPAVGRSRSSRPSACDPRNRGRRAMARDLRVPARGSRSLGGLHPPSGPEGSGRAIGAWGGDPWTWGRGFVGNRPSAAARAAARQHGDGSRHANRGNPETSCRSGPLGHAEAARIKLSSLRPDQLKRTKTG